MTYFMYSRLTNILSKSLKILEGLIKKYQHEFPECSRIIKSIPSKKLLYLSALFHDIAKGRGGDHSILGCKDVEDFGISHDLSQKDTQIIKWLVLNHLLMSQTAQKKDLSDSFEIYSFCLKCEMNVEKIKLLYLLTVADINGTNKKIWNNWKANLLLELYKKSLNFLSSNQSEKKTHNIEKIRKMLKINFLYMDMKQKVFMNSLIIIFLMNTLANLIS